MPRFLLLVMLVGFDSCRCQSSDQHPDASALSRDWLEGAEPEPEQPASSTKGTLTVRAMSEPAGLNFLDDASHDAWTQRFTRNLVYESLLEVNPRTWALEPQLAESWAEHDEHRLTTFTLRRGVVFHDGSAFTARDVIAVFDAVMSGQHPTTAVRADFVDLASWKALDDFTVELRWKKAAPLALRRVAQLPIYPAAALAGDWAALASHPIGTGPFRFEAWERGSKLTLARAPAWHGVATGQAPALERIVFRIVKDHTAAAGLFERGEFDVMTNVQPVLWRAMESREPKYAWAQQGYRRIKSVDNSYSYIGWNEARPFFADVRVRRALAHLYPADVVAKAVDLGLELPTTCPWYAKSDKCDPTVTRITFDPQAARNELTDAGFADADGDGILERDGVPLRFKFLIPATSVRLGKLVPLLAEQAKTAGVDVVVEKADVATMTSRVNARDFDVVSRLWTELDVETDLYQIFHSSQVDGGSNFVGYASPEADRLLEQLRAEWNPSRRLALERALHQQLYADQPYLFMTVRQSLDCAKKRVHNLTPSLLWYDLRRVWVENP